MTSACRTLIPACLAALVLAATAAADIVPLTDLRQVNLRATYEGATAQKYLQPTTPFQNWFQAEVAEVYGAEAGQASATGYQDSQLFKDGNGLVTGFLHAGSAGGEFQVGVGTYEALSLSTMVFRLTTTSDYFIDATLEPGDLFSEGEIVLGHPYGGGHILEVNSGHVLRNGRLAPGDYFIEGRSQVTTHGLSLAGPSYAIFLTAQPTNSPFIIFQPSNVVVPPGGNTNFTVTTSTPSPAPSPEGTAAFAFEWRRNGVPLTNGPKYSGVDTNTLTITNAATADTGWYNVIVTSGPIAEPSRYARLGVGLVDVGPAPAPASNDFRLDPAAPNPSSTSTTFRFSTAQPVAAVAAVYDASGRRVRDVTGGVLIGTGVLTWDGRSDSGDTAPAGIYFLRVRVAGETLTRRFVRMR